MGNYDDARAERDFRMNPPETSPGQGDAGWGELFPEGGSSLEGNDLGLGGGGEDINSILNGTTNPLGQPSMQQQNQSKSGEDIATEAVVFFGKGMFNFLMALGKSFTNNTKGDWHNLGERITIISVICFGVSFLLLLLSPFIKSIHNIGTTMLGCVFAAMPGVALMMFCDKDTTPKEEPQIDIPEEEPTFDFTDDSAFDFTEEDSEEEPLFNDEDDIWSDSDDDIFSEPIVATNTIGSDSFSVDDALNEIPAIPAGTQTRQYLFETYMRVLPRMSPGFSSMKQVTVESDEFMEFNEYLQDAAYQVGTKEDNIPELLELRKNVFIIQLRATRPAGLKEQEIADAIADVYSRDDDNNIVRYGVYGTVNSTVGVLIINIFTGNTAMISLADVYEVIPDFVKDPKNTMPFVWGVNEFGTSLYCDLINCDSIIISGEARSGKSWKGQSIVAQLCMYNSPKEIEFYIFDHKDHASDYRYLSTVLPHVKYFCGDYKKINSGIQRVLDKALKERGSLLADAGCINIKDYNKAHPDNKLPYMYILIDELMSLMDAYDKDEQEVFRKHLSTMVSKLPYLGIRLILFPHRIVNNVIGKNTYSLVSSRAVVRQLNSDELKNAVNVTKREFPYSLVNNGDMALKTKEIANGQTVFCHAEILTQSNESNKDVFKFIGSVWNRLEPDVKCIEINGSIGGTLSILGEGTSAVTRVKSTPPKDNTEGSDLYQYEGYSSTEDAFDLPEDETVNPSEEDFWSDVLGDE